MPSDLLHGFRVGPWTVEPLQGAITGPDNESRHLQPKVMDLLVCLAERANEVVTRDELLNEVWGDHAVSDEPLTHTIGELRRALHDDRGHPIYIETIPKRGYRLIGEVRLPEGSTEQPISESQLPGNAAAASGDSWLIKRSTVFVGAVGLIAIAALSVALITLNIQTPTNEILVTPVYRPPPNSIAVLPFADLSPEADQEYFSNGISDEILNVLAHVPGLQVTARTSSFQFKGDNRDIIDIGQKLNISLVLEGSVRKAGPQIRITAQLVDARNGFHLWSESYDRELENIFVVQDEISAAIVAALKEHLGLQVEAVPRVATTANTEAYNAYLRGRYLVVQRTRTTVEGAIREFEKAISFDPGYALAHAELALATLLLIRDWYGDLTRTEALARATPHAETAMALDPDLAEVHAGTGRVLMVQENAEEALRHFEKAIQINPNYSDVSNWMGFVLARLGRYDEGFAVREKALQLDPLSRPILINYVGMLINRNRFADAERELEELALIYPVSYALWQGWLAAVGGKWTNGTLGLLDVLKIDPENHYPRNWLPRQFAMIGLEKEALSISEYTSPRVLSLLGRPGDAVTTAQVQVTEDPMSLRKRFSLGLALAGAGDYSRGRPILEELWQSSGGRVIGRLGTACAIALIAIRRDAGEEAGVGELVAALRDNVRRYREAGITGWVDGAYSVNVDEGIAAYLAGEREEGLALIAKGAEDGMFILQNEAYLQVLYDDPGFAPIRASQEARQKREREKFLAVVCSDNPYEAVWQPAEGTCERFAAISEPLLKTQ